jgi:hypothetical protein
VTPFFCGLAVYVVLVFNGAPEWAAVGLSIVVGLIVEKREAVSLLGSQPKDEHEADQERYESIPLPKPRPETNWQLVIIGMGVAAVLCLVARYAL